jgi:hypothetical protein
VNANRELWEKGDFTRIAASMRGSGEALVDGLGIGAGMDVLGGRIVMGNWIPGDPTLVAQILKIAAAYTPPPPEGFVSPMAWGVEDEVVDRFGAAGIAAEQIGFERASWTFDFPGTPEELVGLFRDFYGPTMNAFAAAAADGREALLRAELDALFADQNRAEDGRTEIAATFLLVNVTRSYP